jgi:hypothetical protein
MEVQYETEESEPEPEPEIMGSWNRHIRSLVKTFRFAPESYEVSVEPGVRTLSRCFYNEIVDLVRGKLADISQFAMRWTEQAWRTALVLHSGWNGAECYKVPLEEKIFADSTRIIRFFAAEQIEVLQASRLKSIQDTCKRLEEIFARRSLKLITLRDLRRSHKLEKHQVLDCVRTYPDIFGARIAHRIAGGTPSTQIFLKSSSPAN